MQELTREPRTFPPTRTPTPIPSPTARPPLTPIAQPPPAPSGFVPPAPPLPGFVDGLLVPAADGSLVVYSPADNRVETLLGSGDYDLTDSGPMSIVWPLRLSPDGRLVLVPRPAGDTWLARRGDDGGAAEVSQLHNLRLWATWAPDSRRIAFTVAGLQSPEAGGAGVYVQDVAAGEPARLLTELPPFAMWSVWSPGCAAAGATGDCGRSLAVSAWDEDALAIWLVDAATGEKRKLGRFRPPQIDGELWHRWAADGRGVIVNANLATLYFPLDGPARPVVVELGEWRSDYGFSPNGRRVADVIYVNRDYWQVILTDRATGETVTMPQHYETASIHGWSSDGRYALAWLREPREDGLRVGLGLIDTATWPGLPEPIWLELPHLLDTEAERIQQATEVERLPWATTRPAPPAGPPETWLRHEWPDAAATLAAPAGWRVIIDGNAATVANYDVVTQGLLPLGDDQVRVDLGWSYYEGIEPDVTVASMAQQYFTYDVAAVQVGDVAGVTLSDPVTPLCRTVVLPHTANGRAGELWTHFCPATAGWQGFVLELLAQLVGNPIGN
jgi:hypothetical protein